LSLALLCIGKYVAEKNDLKYTTRLISFLLDVIIVNRCSAYLRVWEDYMKV